MNQAETFGSPPDFVRSEEDKTGNGVRARKTVYNYLTQNLRNAQKENDYLQ